MSIATKKKDQGYNPNPSYWREKPTCDLGGFRVGKTGTCSRHTPKKKA